MYQKITPFSSKCFLIQIQSQSESETSESHNSLYHKHYLSAREEQATWKINSENESEIE